MSTYLNEISDNFKSIDITRMSEEEIHEKLLEGYNAYKEGRTQSAAEAFESFRNEHSFQKKI